MISIKGNSAPVNLRYEDYAQGSKNAVLPLIGAALAFEGQQVLDNFPDISDVRSIFTLLDKAEVAYQLQGNTFTKHGAKPVSVVFGRDFFDTRGGFYVVAGLMGKLDQISIDDYLIGGCQIGDRNYNFVFDVFRAFGISVDVCENGLTFARGARAQRRIVLNDLGIVVSGVALILAAQQAEPTELIGIGCAAEINDVIDFLEKNGVKCERTGERDLRVVPVGLADGLPVVHRVQDDRIVIATYIALCLASGGVFTIERSRLVYLDTFITLLSDIGYTVDYTGPLCTIGKEAGATLAGVDVVVDDYPAISTDIQPLLAPLLCSVHGRSTVVDKIFPGRNFHVEQLRRLNQDIVCDNEKIIIQGGKPLIGNDLCSNDMRCSAALMIAASLADGVSTIENWENVERGYQYLVDILSSYAEISFV